MLLHLAVARLALAHEPFDFFVFGCMPYRGADDDVRFARLTEEINALSPAFSVHVGDTKAGSTPCDDAVNEKIAVSFAAFTHPLFYAVGDNEWTDCDREGAGSFAPLERLELVRSRFFAREESLGSRPMPLLSQRQDPAFARYVENTRWQHGGVQFAALHVVGSNNNRIPEKPGAVDEFLARDAANEAWLRAAFAEAKRNANVALVLFIQANPFNERGEARGDGFENFVRVLREETLLAGRPVVLFHADTHYFRIDKPLRDAAGQMIENFTRVETFGGDNLHAVQAHVDAARTADPIRFAPRLIAGNLRRAAPVPVETP